MLYIESFTQIKQSNHNAVTILIFTIYSKKLAQKGSKQ